MNYYCICACVFEVVLISGCALTIGAQTPQKNMACTSVLLVVQGLRHGAADDREAMKLQCISAQQ